MTWNYKHLIQEGLKSGPAYFYPHCSLKTGSSPFQVGRGEWGLIPPRKPPTGHIKRTGELRFFQLAVGIFWNFVLLSVLFFHVGIQEQNELSVYLKLWPKAPPDPQYRLAFLVYSPTVLSGSSHKPFPHALANSCRFPTSLPLPHLRPSWGKWKLLKENDLIFPNTKTASYLHSHLFTSWT